MSLATGLRRGGARSWALACVALVAAVAVGTAVGAPAPTPAPPSGAELATLSAPPTRGPLASQRIYFVMTDRYANGDPSNDRGGKTGARTVTGFDPADAGWFHGGDFAGLRGSCTGAADGLGRIADLGFTAVWITPPFGQRTVQGDSAAYHGYWITDFTAPDPHLGTEQEFGALVTCAHSLGLKVILDVVVNHTGDVVSLTGGSGGYIGPEQVPYRDCRGKPFRPARYVGKPFPCMAARFMPRVPLVAAADRAAKKPAWLNDPTRYHDRGDIDFSSCNTTCLEQGDFFGLDDLFTEREDVVRGLADVYAAWIERYRIDGIRIDTARHVNAAFFKRWLPRIRAAARRAGVPRLPRVRRGLQRGHARADPVRPGPRAAGAARLPAPGPARRLRRRGARRTRHRLRPRRRRLLPGRERGDVHAADIPRQPRHGARRPPPPPALRQAKRPSCGATCWRTRCSTCFAAHRSSTTATRSG